MLLRKRQQSAATLAGERASRFPFNRYTWYMVKGDMFPKKKWTNTKTRRGKSLPADFFIAIHHHYMRPSSQDHRYYLFPAVMMSGNVYFGEGFKKNPSGLSLTKDCLSRTFTWEELEPHVQEFEILKEEIALAANKLLNFLLRRHERTVFYCKCGCRESVPAGRLTWMTQVPPKAKCATCDEELVQKCSSCQLPFDALGGTFESQPSLYFSTKSGKWKPARKAKILTFGSAVECSKKMNLRQGIIRALKNNGTSILVEGIMTEKKRRVKFCLKRTAPQKRDTCNCIVGRNRFGY